MSDIKLMQDGELLREIRVESLNKAIVAVNELKRDQEDSNQAQDYITYDAVKDAVVVTKPIISEGYSMGLGDAYAITSGGSNLFFSEPVKGIHLSPGVCGVVGSEGNQNSYGAEGVVAPSFKDYSLLLENKNLSSGNIDATQVGVLFDKAYTFDVNYSFQAIEFYIKQNIYKDNLIWLTASIKDGDGVDTVIFKNLHLVESDLAKESLQTIWIDTPLELDKGVEVLLRIQVEDSLNSGVFKDLLVAPTITDSNEPWVQATSRTYSYKIASRSPVYTVDMSGEPLSVGDKCADYDGVICIRDHTGVYPMDIFSGDWARVGDTREVSFIGTDTEKASRLVTSYEDSSGNITTAYVTDAVKAYPPIWGDNGNGQGSVNISIRPGTGGGSDKLEIEGVRGGVTPAMYDPTSSYYLNSRVVESNKEYRCKVTSTSGIFNLLDWEEVSTQNNEERISALEGTTAPTSYEFSQTRSIGEGWVVTHVGSTLTEFNTPNIQVFWNGMKLRKGHEVFWVSPTEVTIVFKAVISEDYLLIVSTPQSVSGPVEFEYSQTRGIGELWAVNNIGATYVEFMDPKFKVYFNGALLRKGNEVFWDSSTALHLNKISIATEDYLTIREDN